MAFDGIESPVARGITTGEGQNEPSQLVRIRSFITSITRIDIIKTQK